MTIEPLSALDASFLHAERPATPIHVGAVVTFEAAPLLDDEGELRLDELRQLVVAHLPELPRLRRRVEWPPFGIARPCWVDDDDFDIRRHIDAVQLPPGSGDDDLRALAEELFAVPLDRRHPLWHLRYVTGLSGDRVAMIERVHHALIDGVSGVDLMNVLLDVDPEHRAPPDPVPAVPAAGRQLPLLVEELRAAAATPVRLAAAAGRAARNPAGFLAGAADAVRGLVAATVDGWRAPASSLNATVGNRRALAWVRADLEAVRRAGRAHDAKVNDVLLAAVAGGLRSLLVARDESVDADTTVKVLVPVSRRPDDQRGTLGNQVAGMLLALPVGIADPVERLAAVSAGTARLKASHEADASELLLRVADLLPPAALAVAGTAVAHQPLVNVVVTNVPGAPIPLYLLGARMLEAHPFVPVAGNLALNVAILSYDGACNLGITADPEAVPDLDVFVAGVERELAALDAVAPRPKVRARSAR